MGPLLSTKYNDPVTKYIMMLLVKLHLELYIDYDDVIVEELVYSE